MSTPSIGLLPLYPSRFMKTPCRRHIRQMEAFYATIAEALVRRGVMVETVPLCRRSRGVSRRLCQFL